MKLKIGILITNINGLSNWMLRIITYLQNRDGVQFVLLIKEINSVNENYTNQKSQETISWLLKKLFYFQEKIENLLFAPKIQIDNAKLKAQLMKANAIHLDSINSQSENFLSISDYNLISELQLDMIFQSGFFNLNGVFAKDLKYGIWSLKNHNSYLNANEFFGFFEVLKRNAGIEVTLEQSTQELENRLIIDKAFFNLNWSYFKTKRVVFESSVSLVIKNIEKILKDANFEVKSINIDESENYKSPSLLNFITYLVRFYTQIAKVGIRKINYFLFSSRYDCWTLFLGKGDFLDASLTKLIPVNLPKNEFWADPFLLEHDDDLYVFFENYEYDKDLGKLSCAKIVDGTMQPAIDILIKDYHLSYPFIFREDDDLYLMPETSQNDRLEIYKCKNFPNEWELYRTAFEGEKIVDTTLYTDKNGIKWLFLNKSVDPNVSFANELFIYQLKSLDTMQIEPHAQNPVLIDASVARNGGAIFEKNGRVYRPSQCNIQGVYGRALNINEISVLTLDHYEEKTIKRIFPDFTPRLKAMHHVHQIEKYFVFDASYTSYKEGN